MTVIPAVGLFLLFSVGPLAQSNKLPAPASHVNDLAGVVDAQTKSRLEGVLQRLKVKTNIDLYVATVETTGTQTISQFSEQLARDWNIGAKSTRREKSTVGCFGQFEDFVHTVQSRGPTRSAGRRLR